MTGWVGGGIIKVRTDALEFATLSSLFVIGGRIELNEAALSHVRLRMS